MIKLMHRTWLFRQSVLRLWLKVNAIRIETLIIRSKTGTVLTIAVGILAPRGRTGNKPGQNWWLFPKTLLLMEPNSTQHRLLTKEKIFWAIEDDWNCQNLTFPCIYHSLLIQLTSPISLRDYLKSIYHIPTILWIVLPPHHDTVWLSGLSMSFQ